MPSEQIEPPLARSSAVPVKLHLEINLGLLTLGLLFLPLLLLLGFWQLDRAEEKKALLAAHQSRQSVESISLSALDSQALTQLSAFTKVKLVAQLKEDRFWFLDNRIHAGRVGYEVLQAAQVNDHWLLINRGWVAGSYDRSLAPSVQMLSGSVNLSGQIAKPSKNIMMAELPVDPLMPQRIVEIDLAKISSLSGVSFAALIQLDAESDGALVTDWPTVNISPTKHQAYAAQWFSMALALVVLLLFANTNLRHVLRQKTINK